MKVAHITKSYVLEPKHSMEPRHSMGPFECLGPFQCLGYVFPTDILLLVKLLLEKAADVDSKDTYGRTPL
jgi:hypothetical protein